MKASMDPCRAGVVGGEAAPPVLQVATLSDLINNTHAKRI